MWQDVCCQFIRCSSSYHLHFLGRQEFAQEISSSSNKSFIARVVRVLQLQRWRLEVLCATPIRNTDITSWLHQNLEVYHNYNFRIVKWCETFTPTIIPRYSPLENWVRCLERIDDKLGFGSFNMCYRNETCPTWKHKKTWADLHCPKTLLLITCQNQEMSLVDVEHLDQTYFHR